MSYSFQVRAATVALALAAAGDAFAKVVASQPVHAADQEPALGAASVFADLLHPDDSKDVVINMSGYLSWPSAVQEGDLPSFSGTSFSVSVSQVPKE